MRTIRSESGSDISLTWTIYNRTDDLIYIDHNNNTIIKLWPEKKVSNPAPEYIDRLDFSFVKQGRDLRLNLLLKDISSLDEGLYRSYIQLHRKEIETVKVIVTGKMIPITLDSILDAYLIEYKQQKYPTQ
ncbi:hypothetical protein CHS0354_001315 [Potamilus streckersoni]|uniref:Uncharacterized protein n=1 Tax=Potamilus streckersoni TaxID=2493646 RepID=A0AAE0RV04_9BIVA|nr:hypothetical protein CHS0354_001315 [Potamilus streckersoni]